MAFNFSWSDLIGGPEVAVASAISPELKKVLFGDQGAKQDAQQKINDIKSKIATANDPSEVYRLNKQLERLTGQMNTQLQNNGVMNAQGQFTNPNDVKNKYIDQSYLQNVQNQATQTRDLALSNALKESKRKQMEGFNTGLADVVGSTENVQNQMGQQVSGAIKQENESAYNKAVQDISNKFQMTKSLNDSERATLQSVINNRMQQAYQTGVLSERELQQAQQDLANIPDGLLIQGAQYAGQAVGTIFGGMFGGPAGAQAGGMFGKNMGGAVGKEASMDQQQQYSGANPYDSSGNF